jgi:hypothetical protein
MAAPEKSSVSDEALEMQIDTAYECMLRSSDPAEQSVYWEQMARLVRVRSPERILRMERERRIT